jgi:hypothetical protein
LAARTINGTLKGYLSSTFNEDGLYRITSNLSQALSVALSASSVTGVFSADIVPVRLFMRNPFFGHGADVVGKE